MPQISCCAMLIAYLVIAGALHSCQQTIRSCVEQASLAGLLMMAGAQLSIRQHIRHQKVRLTAWQHCSNMVHALCSENVIVVCTHLLLCTCFKQINVWIMQLTMRMIAGLDIVALMQVLYHSLSIHAVTCSVRIAAIHGRWYISNQLSWQKNIKV